MPNEPRRAFRWLLLAALPVYVIYLGANSIWDANEAFYVETPRQMVLSGDYVNPTFNALERFNKPVLSYWIVAGLYRLFGISVTVERVGIALGALGIIAATFAIGRALRSPPAGAIAALLVATAPRVVFFARRIFIDVYITLFMSLTLAFFVLAERHPEHRRRYLLLMYAAIGLGVLTKGPIAVVLPALIVGAWLLIERRLADLRRLMIVPGALIVILIAAPWYVAVGLTEPHGWQHARAFFLGENLGRFTSAMTTERGPGFFLGVLFGDLLLPWAPLLIAVIVSSWRRRRDQALDPGASIRRLLWLWIIGIVGVFSFSASKEDLYIFSAVPAAAVLIADALVATRFGLDDRPLRIGLACLAVAFIAASGIVQVYFGAGYYRIAASMLVASALAATGLAALVFVMRHRYAAAFIAMAGGLIALNYVFVARVLPDLERLKPVPKLAALINAVGKPGYPQVGFCNMTLPSLVYYADRAITPLDGVPHAKQFLRDYSDPWVLMGVPEWEELKDSVPGGLCEVDRMPIFDTRISDILSGTPPKDLILAKRCR